MLIALKINILSVSCVTAVHSFTTKALPPLLLCYTSCMSEPVINEILTPTREITGFAFSRFHFQYQLCTSIYFIFVLNSRL